MFRLFDTSSFVLVCLLSSYITVYNLVYKLLFICYNYYLFLSLDCSFATVWLIIPSLATTSAYKLTILFTSNYVDWLSCKIVYSLPTRSACNFDIFYLLSFNYMWSYFILSSSFVICSLLFLLSSYQPNFNSDILFSMFWSYWSFILIY